MANTVMAGALLTQGLKSEFVKVWSENYETLKPDLGEIVWLGATSDKLTEFYAFLESAPYPVRWDRGTVISSKAMKSVQFSVTNRDWAARIYYHHNDEQDDQTGSLYAQARELGANWGTLAERVFFQFIQAGTDANLLPTVPNSADGVALYSSSTRFGSSGGNQVTESGTTTVQQIITDTMSVFRRYNEFQNTESQPLWNMSQTKNLTVIYAPELALVMNQALTAMAVFGYQAGTSTTDTSTAAGIDNVLKTAGFSIKPIMSQRITDTSRYFFLRGLPDYKKPIFQQVREGFSEALGNWETSDHTRDTGEKYLQFRSREGYGSALAYATIKLT